MRRLIRHIERLLFRETCVVIPGVGAFLRHTEGAVADYPKGLIYPGHSRISFNSALNQNDGLLVKSYSDAYSYGYKRSLRLLEKDIEELKSELLASGVVQMGEVGQLLRARSGAITFVPNESHPFSVDTYGLQPVAMLPAVSALETKRSGARRSRREGDIYYLPINLRYLGYSGVAAALAAIALLIPNDRLHVPDSLPQYQASFVANTPLEQKEAITVEEAEPVEAPLVEETVVEPNLLGGFKAIEESEAKDGYYVVIATLSSASRVEKFLEENKSFSDYAEEGGILISRSGMHRIYAQCFETSADAQAYLNTLREQPTFSTSWVYRP